MINLGENVACSGLAINYEYIADRLTSNVKVRVDKKEQEFKALWDTGATVTCISEDVVKSLSLIPKGKQNIQTPSGSSTVNTYLIDIILPNDVEIKDVTVCDSEIGKQGIGVLIGMNIISQGDFAISNYNKKTTFSFRIPSLKVINLSKELIAYNAIRKSHTPPKKSKKKNK